MKDWVDEVCWDANGLAPVVVQDYATGRVLMHAWMNRESLRLTQEEGRGVFWSRSRGRLWRKGEESGHVQTLREMRLDCDNDTLLLRVEQVGGIACHTGRQSCFYRVLRDGRWETVDAVIKDPSTIYKSKS